MPPGLGQPIAKQEAN